jgi:anti-sigma regulatory factor (Ser/Thr protein kinase)
MPLSLKLEVPSDPQMLSVVRSTVQQLAAVAGFPDRECRLITLAVDEAMTNIIRHAYGSCCDKKIALLCEQRNGRLEFVLEDCGASVPPEQFRGRALGQAEPGGLGLNLIGQIMDQVAYEPAPGCNRLRLAKKLPGTRGQGE